MPPRRQPRTETEYAGVVPLPATVQPKEPSALKPHEKLRLGHLTGQEETTDAPLKPGFMHGVDPDYPEVE